MNDVGLKVNVENYWAKGMWPTNSPDFSPFENVRAILQEKADKAYPPPSTIEARGVQRGGEKGDRLPPK